MDKPLEQTRIAVLQRQRREFQKLLRDVWDRSLFYRDYYASHGIKDKDISDLGVEDLPFVTKDTLMENFDAAVLDPHLRKKELETWIENVRDPRQFYSDDLIVLHSSGSSGKIAIFVYDRKAWQVMTGTVATRLPPPKRGPHGRRRVASYLASHGHFGGITASLLLPGSAYEILILSLLDAEGRVVEGLNNFQPDQLGGYSSSVAMLAEWAIDGRLAIRPDAIIVSGDLLTPSMERRIKEAWAAPIYVVYAASESIYLGIKGPGQEEMTVIDDLNVLEILDHANRPVAPGETGRAVLTNLYNQALPILRYELGDYLIRGKGEQDSPFATIGDIRGRVNDALPVVLENGAQDSIHPIILSEFFTPGLEKVQFISRRPDRVDIHYIADRDIDSGVQREFKRILEMKRALQTSFEVHRVRQIDVDPQTGKLRLVRVEDGRGNLLVERVEVPPSRPAARNRYLGPKNPFVNFEKNDIEQSISERFEQQVNKYPELVAVKGKSGAFTYRALNQRANRVARAILRQQGVSQEPVALLLEHDSPLVAAILGVLKAGEFYVPLDPSHLQASLSRILDDAGASWIVTDEKNLSCAKALAQSARSIINIDDLDVSLSDENLGLPISPDAPAYILYTSGSTAQPKGVLHSHRNTLHHIMNYTNAFHVCAGDRLTLLHSASFIMSTVDMFCALLNGATVCLFDARAEGMIGLANWLRQEEITIYNWTTTAFRVFAEALDQKDKLAKLRLIVLGGEAVTHRDVELYKNRFAPECLLVNRLGSTETGNYRLYFVNKQTEVNPGIVPAGYAVEDKEVLLLDEGNNRLGFNEVGEIAVKSRYLALGYWRQPALTDVVFLRDPKGGDDRLYLTGDFGLMRPDGCLEYIGRKDFRCKIRGQWVDIAEVEALLAEHPAVREAVVVPHDNEAGEKRLAAYVVPANKQTPSASKLRGALRSKMPEHMVPSAFVFLDSLPLNLNGKVDRRALPEPSWSLLEQDGRFVAPRTPLEAKLARIWCEVLGVDQVGVYDDFFELGGHSLLAAQIASRVYTSLEVELSLRSFFEKTNVAALADIIAQSQAQNMSPEDLTELFAGIESLSEANAQESIVQLRDVDNDDTKK